MNPIDTVLAATDFSAPARHAADRAGRVANELAARVELLHVVSQGALDELRGSVTRHVLAEANCDVLVSAQPTA